MNELTPFGHWDPFREINDMMKDFFGDFIEEHKTPGSFMTSVGKQSYPKLNVKYNKKDKVIVIEASLPNSKKEDISIEIKPGEIEGQRGHEVQILTISGRSTNSSSSDDEGYIVREISRTSFSRSLVLPDSITEKDLEAVKTTLKGGLLSITIPCELEVDEPKVRRLEIDEQSE